ncbi:MAG: RagB/SusD family nutrient uptake outer membrane protein, partial [Gemmatimonadota bacterium]
MIDSRIRRLARLVLMLGLTITVSGCSDLLDVEAPSRIPAEDLESPAQAALLLNGAKADFECAFGAYAVLSGALAGELMDATQTASRWPYTRREVTSGEAMYGINSCAALGIYKGFSTARFDADVLVAKLQTWTDAEVTNRQSMLATAAAYSGHSHVFLGEGFCSGVLLDEKQVPGGEVTRAEVFNRAIQRFATAIDAAKLSNNTQMLNLALVGRARAYLNIGNKSAAIADASLVPSGFVYNATASTINSRRFNRVFQEVNQTNLHSIGVEYRAFTHMGAPDPRVKVNNLNRNATDGTPLFTQTRYSGQAAPLPMASYEEAQLIIAEAKGGQDAVAIINALHTKAGLPAFASSDANEIQSHVIAERQAELFLTGHRLFDVDRFKLARLPAAGTQFPKGGSYGSTSCFPLPDIEKLNNPA